MSQLQSKDTPQNWFQTTHWSRILSASGEGSQARESLEQLCGAYWYPLYAFVRRQGFDQFEAEDLTQSFFEHLLQRDRFARADSNKGRFRTYLLSSLQNYLNDARDHSRRLKRGGGAVKISWDAQDGENRYRMEPKDHLSPEVLFDRRWAAMTVSRARLQVRTEFHQDGKGGIYDLLTQHEEGTELSYEEIAGQLTTTVSAVKSAAFRLRRRLREVLWEEIAQTVASPQDMESELRNIAQLAAQEGL